MQPVSCGDQTGGGAVGCALAQALIDNPSDSRDLMQWARDVGASPRTLNRMFLAETGMPFRDWRLQCRLQYALERLSAGGRVTDIALDLGYSNASAFIAMFRQRLGETPARYRRRLSGWEASSASMGD